VISLVLRKHESYWTKIGKIIQGLRWIETALLIWISVAVIANHL